MMLGMAAFVPVRLALAAQGYTALLDSGSIDFQAWMAPFMVAPMVTWMRVRGCNWRDIAEMSTAMLPPMAAVLTLRWLGLSETMTWLANSQHAAMLLAMLVLMLYRREHYTSGYSFLHWQAAPPRRGAFHALEALAPQEQAVEN